MRIGFSNKKCSPPCRVWIDLTRVRANLQLASDEREEISELDVYEWLSTLGLEPDESGAWIGTERSLRHLADDEITRIERAA